MNDIFSKLFDVLDGRWKDTISGATTDGAASMTGRCEGGGDTHSERMQTWIHLHVVRLVSIGHCCSTSSD